MNTDNQMNPLSSADDIRQLKQIKQKIRKAPPGERLQLETDVFQKYSGHGGLLGEMSRLSLMTVRNLQAEVSVKVAARIGKRALEEMIQYASSCTASFALGALGSSILYGLKEMQNPEKFVLPVLERVGPAGSPDFQTVPDTLRRVLHDVPMGSGERRALMQAASEGLYQADPQKAMDYMVLRTRAVCKDPEGLRIAAEEMKKSSKRPGDAEALDTVMGIAQKVLSGDRSFPFSKVAEKDRPALSHHILALGLESVTQSHDCQYDREKTLLHAAHFIPIFTGNSGEDGISPKGVAGYAILDGIAPLLSDPGNRQAFVFGKEMADLVSAEGHPDLVGGMVEQLTSDAQDLYDENRELPFFKKMLLLTFNPQKESGLVYQCGFNPDCIHAVVMDVLDRVTRQKEDTAAADEAMVGRARIQNLAMDRQSDFETMRDVFNRILNAGELRAQSLKELQEAYGSPGDAVDVFDTYISIRGVKLPVRDS